MNSADQNIQNNEAFLKLFLKHESGLKAYIRSCVIRPEEVDEIMQEVSLVAWRKFETLEQPEKFGAWACLIARFEILKFRRKKARDRLVLDEDIIAKIGIDAEEQVSRRQLQLSALDKCLKKLRPPEKHLVRQAYTPKVSKKELAEEFGKTEAAFYQKLARIRIKLRDCMNHKMIAINTGVLE
jgi:RNA polymerase sigma-70 factor (ECF subfamily)